MKIFLRRQGRSDRLLGELEAGSETGSAVLALNNLTANFLKEAMRRSFRKVPIFTP